MKTLSFFKDYLTEKYGHPLYRIPIDLGLSCPHRDENGEGGCVFCAEDGSLARHLQRNGLELSEQVRLGKEYIIRRYNAEPPYIAYFQSFTGTNADPETLRSLYREVLAMEDFKVVIIATRSDCLPDDCLDLLQEFSKDYELWIELGVQSVNDTTLERINRGHDFESVKSAATRLNERGIKVAAHVIIGLPGETHDDFMNTAKEIAKLPFSAVKIHNLLILKHTPLEKSYHANPFHTLNEYEYARELVDFVHELPDSMLLMRVSAEAPAEEVVVPKWWMKKGQFLEMFIKLFESDSAIENTGMTSQFIPIQTGDGSYTLYHPQYKQHFHSLAGAWEESLKKYIEPCRIKEKLASGENISILDVGFGMGCNVSAVILLAESIGRSKVYIVSLEMDRNVIDAALSLLEHPGKEILESVRDTGRYESHYASLDIMWGDARESVSYMKSHYDYIFLDAFSPDTNPELWTYDFVTVLKTMLKEDGYLASYCSAFPFAGALMKADFLVFESKPFGRKRGGIIASLGANPWLPPLSEKDRMIITKSTAGVPYRDPGLNHSREEILENRKKEVAALRAEGMPKWYVQKN